MFKYSLRWVLLIVSTIGVVLEGNATHLRAGDITLTRTSCSNFEYIITLHIYTKYHTPVKFGGGTLDFGDCSKTVTTEHVNDPPDIAHTDDGDVGEVTYSYTFPGMIHTFPGPGVYTITYYEEDRNEGILNMDNSVGTPFFIQTQIVIDAGLGCDNTPQLLVPPIDQGCTGVTWSHNPGAYDIDGDSLSYELFVPKQGAVYGQACKITSSLDVQDYQAPNSQRFYDEVGIPYSKANEAQNNIPSFSIDAVTGTITWDAPGEAGEYNIAFLIREWRKIVDLKGVGHWVSLGYVERDMQVIIKDCNNLRPQFLPLTDICVLAGTTITQDVYATDPDGSATGGANGLGDSVKIEAFSQAFSANPPADYTPKPVVFQPTFDDLQQAHLQFTWATNCRDVKEQPYEVVFKATDNGAPPLATFTTWKIKIVAPPPQWDSIHLYPGTRSAVLYWKPYLANCQGATSMQIWRRVDSYPFTPSNCVTGMPDNLGYTLINTIPISSSTYTDNSLAVGAEYCYRLVAEFPATTGGGESYVSDEYCIPPILASAPVVTNVTVDITDQSGGQITVKWTPPFQASQTQFPPPYTYEVFRADNLSGNLNLKQVNPGKISDTTFVDGGLNTTDNTYNYRILAYANNGSFVDTSAVASSVQLILKPLFEEIQLNWSAIVPWSNNTLEYPRHLIYRGTTGATTISDLVLFDSVNVNQQQFYFLDSGQHDAAKKLDKTKNYCYAVMTRGSYGNPKIKTPLVNFSEITCSQPNDSIPPCKPVLSVTGIDCSTYTSCPLIGNSGSTSFSNTIIWKKPTDPNCKQDIKGYTVYSANTTDGTFVKIAEGITDTFYVHRNLPSFAQCYKISAVDRAGNESQQSDPFCFDNCPYYELPNVFTPNGDGCNDVFSAFSLRNYGETNPCSSGDVKKDSTHLAFLNNNCARFVLAVTFTVFNRWGKEVYTYQSGGENTIYIDWNGKDDSGRDLDTGTYYFIAQVVFDVVDPKKKNKTIKGWVELLR